MDIIALNDVNQYLEAHSRRERGCNQPARVPIVPDPFQELESALLRLSSIEVKDDPFGFGDGRSRWTDGGAAVARCQTSQQQEDLMGAPTPSECTAARQASWCPRHICPRKVGRIGWQLHDQHPYWLEHIAPKPSPCCWMGIRRSGRKTENAYQQHRAACPSPRLYTLAKMFWDEARLKIKRIKQIPTAQIS